MKDLFTKLHKYEIQIRKAIKSHLQGDFHSVFKGTGIEFDDVRTYQYGDDVRTINWNVTAKGTGTYVKTFKEEKEQTVFFLLDISASQEIGNPGTQKIDVGKEICGILALSAIKELSQVGLICFSDKKEKYLQPGKGMKHAYQILNTIFNIKPESVKTSLNNAILYALNIIKKRSIVILISDFIDDGYEHNLKGLARKHDLIVIQISDKRESSLPGLGIIPLLDKETGNTIWTNTSSKAFKQKWENEFIGNQKQLETLCKKNQADYLPISTDENYVPKLIKLFKIRNKVKKSA
jgi:uncharacterized protein (DUF58 family)